MPAEGRLRSLLPVRPANCRKRSSAITFPQFRGVRSGRQLERERHRFAALRIVGQERQRIFNLSKDSHRTAAVPDLQDIARDGLPIQLSPLWRQTRQERLTVRALGNNRRATIRQPRHMCRFCKVWRKPTPSQRSVCAAVW
jgi:hypothetical protein